MWFILLYHYQYISVRDHSLTKTEKELEELDSRLPSTLKIWNATIPAQFLMAPTHVMPVITNQDPHHFRPNALRIDPF